jgi:hypothetical protein
VSSARDVCLPDAPSLPPPPSPHTHRLYLPVACLLLLRVSLLSLLVYAPHRPLMSSLCAACPPRLANAFGEGKRILFCRNHGVFVIGPSVAECYDDLYYLERACRIQALPPPLSRLPFSRASRSVRAPARAGPGHANRAATAARVGAGGAVGPRIFRQVPRHVQVSPPPLIPAHDDSLRHSPHGKYIPAGARPQAPYQCSYMRMIAAPTITGLPGLAWPG